MPKVSTRTVENRMRELTFLPRKKEPRNLGQLNASTFFCKGCGMAERQPDGVECPTCVSITKAAWNVHEPMPIAVHIAFVLALLVTIIGVVLALRI